MTVMIDAGSFCFGFAAGALACLAIFAVVYAWVEG